MYGTHILHDILYGGKIDIFQTIHSSKEVYSTTLATEINSELDVSYANIINGSLNSSKELKKSLETKYKAEQVTTTIKTLGGNSFNFSSMDMLATSVGSWYNSLKSENYYPVSVNSNGAMPIWDFLPDEYSEFKRKLLDRFSGYTIANLAFKDKKISLPDLELNFEHNSEVRIKSGRFKNNSTVFKLGSVASFDKLKELGYSKVKIELELKIKEVNNGYQGILIFSNNNESNNYYLDGIEFEHGGSKKETTYGDHRKSFDFQITDFNEGMIVLRYGARGFLGDNWYRKNLKLKVIIS